MTHDRDGPRPTMHEFRHEIAEAALEAVCAAARGETTRADLEDFSILPEELEAEGWELTAPTPRRVEPAARSMTTHEIAAEIAAGRDPWADGAGGERAPSAGVAPASHLLAALALSELPDSPETLTALFRPGHVARLVCPSAAMRAAIKEVGDTMLDACAARVSASAPECRLVVSTREGGNDRDKRGTRLDVRIAHCIEAGSAALIVAGHAEQLPAEVRALCGMETRWRGLSAEMVVTLLKRTHSATGQVAEEAVRARLPGGAALRRLELLQIDAAFLEPNTLAVAERLAEIAEAHVPRSGARLERIAGVDEVARAVRPASARALPAAGGPRGDPGRKARVAHRARRSRGDLRAARRLFRGDG